VLSQPNEALISLTRIKGSDGRKAVNPGWVRTDRGERGAQRSPDEGADTAVRLATLPDGGPSGGFFSDRTRIGW